MNKLVSYFVRLIFAIVICSGYSGPRPNTGNNLQPGDIIYADSAGFVVKVNSKTGEQGIISAGSNLNQPYDLILDPKGQVLVSAGGLIKINPNTGVQSVIANNAKGTLGTPFGIALDGNGDVVVANAQSLLRVNPANGRTQVISSGGRFLYPIGVAIGQGGELVVLNMAFPPEVLLIDPASGNQTVLAQGGYLNGPQGIAIDSQNNIYVTDVANDDRNFGIGRVIHINSQTGVQTIVSEGTHLVGPMGITVDQSGQLIVADPYTINPNNYNLFDGGIIGIDPVSGAQTLIARGFGSIVNPQGVAVVR